MLSFVVALILSYLYHGLGITVGYHRLLTHRSFKCPQWLEYLVVSGGYFAFEGSPIAWVCTHRVHHRYTDKEGDPHRPADGFWHSFAMWLVKPKVSFTNEQIEQVCPDLCRDKVYRALDFNHTRTHALVCLIACIIFRVVLFVLFGPWVVVANLIGAGITFIGPFLVNSVCHLENHGYKNFATEDDARNVWWVGLIALGEGWHNNHHAVPQCARHGLRATEFDISWVFISLMRSFGLITNVRIPKEPKNWPITDPAFAQRYTRLYNENIEANGDNFDESGLVTTRQKLVEQINAANVLASQLAETCEQLAAQLSAAKGQLAEQVAEAPREPITESLMAARTQATQQLITACDQLSEQLDDAKAKLAYQIQFAREQLADHLHAFGPEAAETA